MKKYLWILVALLLVSGSWWAFSHSLAWHHIREGYMEKRAYRAERLFKNHDPDHYDEEIFRLAQRIEWGDALSARDLEPIKDRINNRYGKEITLLFHALRFDNIAAIDALLAAGADPTMIDRPSTVSKRDFIYYLTYPGGSLLGQDGINQLIRIYLKHGGDPNYRFKGNIQETFIAEVALVSNHTGMRILLEAGADPWLNTIENGTEINDNMMTNLAFEYNGFEQLHQLIDENYFDDVKEGNIRGFPKKLGGYAQREDEISINIQNLAKRILKRYPQVHDEPIVLEIFKKNWKTDAPGVIPWDEINSDKVR